MDVEAQDELQCLGSHFIEPADLLVAGVVDEDADGAIDLDAVQQSPNGLAVGEIGGVGRPAELGGQGEQLIRSTCDEGHSRPRSSQSSCEVGTDPPTGTGNQGPNARDLHSQTEAVVGGACRFSTDFVTMLISILACAQVNK